MRSVPLPASRAACAIVLILSACQSGPPPEPESRKAPTPTPTPAVTAAAEKPRAPAPPPVETVAKPRVAEVPVTPGDPMNGKFTLEDATKGLAGTGKLVAEMKTDKGTLKCELYDDKAPITVANFVGLARGV